MSSIANKQVICDILMEQAAKDPSVTVLCSDSRGSASLAPFADAFPAQFVEIGIAEQNLVSISAGLARCGMRPFAASPACFLSSRSLEQVKVDVAYSETNVKLIGISGGVSYGTLGLTHHSTSDIASLASLPYMRVYLPSDSHQTRELMRHLVVDDKAAYVRVGRNPVPDVYEKNGTPFVMDKATVLREGKDAAIIACGEMVKVAKDAGEILEKKGINTTVIDMYCLKPFDQEAVLRAAKTGRIVTIEEHVPHGGLGSLVCQTVATKMTTPVPVRCLSLPDSAVVAGSSPEVFAHYGLTPEGLVKNVLEMA